MLGYVKKRVRAEEDAALERKKHRIPVSQRVGEAWRSEGGHRVRSETSSPVFSALPTKLRAQGQRFGNVKFGFRLAKDGKRLERDPARTSRARRDPAQQRGLATVFLLVLFKR